MVQKGISNHRWIVGGKLCLLLNKLGLIVGWDFDTANVYDAVFHPLIETVIDQMIVLADTHKTPENHQNVKYAALHQFYFRNTLLVRLGLGPNACALLSCPIKCSDCPCCVPGPLCLG